MRFEMVTIARDEFEAMKAWLPCATREGLFETYRISQNSWYKLRDGQPVKRQTIERLRERYLEVIEA
ncbi:hypothetical protein FHR22_004483 [Sphingopyxis panaciterrae]|uniref:hypothetical protein n=1 Tax=Sphingopyxis panaciterrae TaxID=363841 RepID=UPI0014214380|nr:hypothetical protein [Sphingopyxis panaciterrae]NIJ39728.1 hypothetical protein [Sphingopyxis panaciterrae]